jgi:hypothetical protein
MAWSNKGQGAGISLWFAIFYSLLTAGIALSMVFIPKALMDTSVKPIPIDQAVQAQQIKSRMWMTNEFTGQTNPFTYLGDLTGLDQLYTQKQMTYKVTLGTKSATYDETYFKRITPIARWNAVQYAEKRKVIASGIEQELTIEEYYPKKYELKK